MTLTKTYAVSSIETGTVIDHIKAGNALKIIQLLKLAKHQQQVTVGLNLESKRLGLKDLIKVEGWELNPEEVNQIAILAPEATISIIKNYTIEKKEKVSLPSTISGVIDCPNSRCVTNHETTKSTFNIINRYGNHIRLQCHYCRQVFSIEDKE